MRNTTHRDGKRKKNRMVWLILLAVLIVGGVYLYWGNTALETTRIEIVDAKIPDAFENFTIVHISDLHNKEFGGHQKALLEKIAALSPDIIVVTGDLIDSYHPGLDAAAAFINGAVTIAPVYYANGNHEARIPEQYAQIKQRMRDAGAVILENEGVTIERNAAIITLFGVNDPAFSAKRPRAQAGSNEQIMAAELGALMAGARGYTILLSHRPELLDTYRAAGVDLVMSGHAHGGLIRLPLIGAVFAPNQDFFPKYTSGLYEGGGTKMVVSRGLGGIPLRVNNRPQIVAITLKAGKS